MDILQLKIIETLVAITISAVIHFTATKFVDKTIKNSLLKKARGKIIKKIIRLLNFSIFSIIILVIWGVDKSELAVFVGSILTVVGIALFAQWSVLSNITTSIIIFFNHPIKLEDTITIIDKDYHIEGRVSDIGLFFIILKTKDGEQIVLPNNVFIQKMIKKNRNA